MLNVKKGWLVVFIGLCSSVCFADSFTQNDSQAKGIEHTECTREQEAANKALVLQLIDDGQNARNLAVVGSYLSAEFIDRSESSNPNTDHSKAGSLEIHRQLFSAFPDFQVVVHQQIAECDKVMTHKSFTGTHKGEFFGYVATGKQMEFNVIDILRMENGLVVEHWVETNMVEQLQRAK